MQIPREVWHFGVEQVKLYPLNQIAFNDARREIESLYIDSGMSSPPNASGVVVHSGVAPQVSRYEAKQNALNNPHYRYLARCVAIMEIIQQMEDNYVNRVLVAIWDIGWQDNSAIAKKAGLSLATVKRAKHEIIRRVAVGWGLW